MKLSTLTALCLTIAGLASPALADPARDARCLSVFAAAIYQADDAAEKNEIMPFALFYMGKLQGEVPGQSVEALVRANVPPLTDEALGEVVGPCMELMSPAVADMESSTKFIDDAVGKKPQ